jgi:ATP-dependent DNA helicase RecG
VRTDEVRALLARLDGEPADALESETLECKSWRPDERDACVRDVREAVVCFANARGGLILLGIHDRRRTRADAIHGVANISPDELRKKIYDGTVPPILVDIEELPFPEGDVLLLRVPRGIPPHTTTEGVGRVRVGKECKPLTGPELVRLFLSGGSRDLTAETISGASVGDLDPEQVKTLQRLVSTEGQRSDVARLAPEELLHNLHLLRDGEPTVAAVLLLGRSPALARWTPQHEVVFLRYSTQTKYDVRHDLRGPILAVIEALERLLRAHLRVGIVEAGGFEELSRPDVSWWAAREAILNALVHRDYFVRQSAYVELRPDRLEVSSPGGFPSGVTASNILRHPPVRRNPALADALQAAGYVNRAAVGVDRIYEELLRLGKGLPRYETDESHVRLILPTRTHLPFARFVAQETRAGRTLTLDDLIVLRTLAEQGIVDRWSASTRDDAAAVLVSLRERGYVVPVGRGKGTSYRFSRALSDAIRGRSDTDLDMPLDDHAVRLRIEAVLAERGRLTNVDVRRLSGYSRAEVVRMMNALREQGLAELAGRGRSAHYVPGPKLLRGPGGRRRDGSRR